MAIFGTPQNDALDGTELADTIIGYAGDDALDGKGGNDLLSGDDGNDLLKGGDGNDLLNGGLDVGPDSDQLDGGNGFDTVTYGQVQHAMLVELGAGTARARDASGVYPKDVLISTESVNGTNFGDFLGGGSGANSLSGSGGNDTLESRGGNDKLSGGPGNDALLGGSGVDQLTGGADADQFYYNGTGDSGVGLGKRDVVADFQRGVDKIDLHAVDAMAGASGEQGFSFIGKDTFTAEGQVRFFFEGDHTVVALNTSGTSGAEAQIELTGNVSLAEGDFLL